MKDMLQLDLHGPQNILNLLKLMRAYYPKTVRLFM